MQSGAIGGNQVLITCVATWRSFALLCALSIASCLAFEAACLRTIARRMAESIPSELSRSSTGKSSPRGASSAQLGKQGRGVPGERGMSGGYGVRGEVKGGGVE